MLAKILNLSVSTVSKALRDSYDIGTETKEKVLALAKDLNYQPNPHASSLRKNKSKTIAVILPEISNNYFGLAMNGIESVAEEKGYHVLIYLTHEDYKKEVMYARHLANGRVDGVLVSVSSTTCDISHLRELKEKDIPIVFFDRVCEDVDTVKVTTNDYESGLTATRHLIEQGCTKIGHLAISNHISIGNKRMLGYRQALLDHNISCNKSLIVNCTNDDKKDFESIKTLLRTQKCDGVFAAVERYAILTYEVCRELQLSIPKDVKVISFSNLQTASLLNPSMTTITQPAFEIGKTAASMLFKALDKKSFVLTDETIVLQSALIKRASTSF
ncbi:MAG TPA: LacI family DNA-binding transcriptional regulator [Agriterribacter sp.]|nr:LacI family DNA-binding transcriptional regulator [Agriterribacter sp.]